ncbi:MAG: exosortase system-associated protein, TIGR04073 family [Candidatus Omnitrophota bacterium]
MEARKMLFVIVVAALTIVTALPASFISVGYCADSGRGSVNMPEQPKGDPLKKLGRGLSNIMTFPLEIPSQISKTNNSDGPVAALSYGVVKGFVMGIFRAFVGIYEVVSFPLPYPEWYRPILTDPEFMLESWDL